MAWLTGWNRRKSKTINGTTTIQTNYQMKFIIYKGSGSDAADVVYCNNNCRDDFGDIRFTKSDGSTLLNYWIESYISANSATVWVQIDSIPASPNSSTIYLYYDRSTATSTSNGFNTFLFFDHFDDYTTNDITEKGRWTKSGSPSITITGSVATIDGTASQSYGIESVSSFGPNTAMNLYLYDYVPFSSASGKYYPSAFGYGRWTYPPSTNTLSQQAQTSPPPTSMFCAENGSILTTVSTGINGANWQKWKILYNTTTSRMYLNDVEKGNISTNLPSAPMKATIGVSQDEYTKIGLDYIFVYNQVSPEPGYGAWGTEEIYTCTSPSCHLIVLSKLSKEPPGYLDLDEISRCIDELCNMYENKPKF